MVLLQVTCVLGHDEPQHVVADRAMYQYGCLAVSSITERSQAVYMTWAAVALTAWLQYNVLVHVQSA